MGVGVLRRLARELSVTLRRGGLPVEEALYWGLPDRLSRLLESGHLAEHFAPSEVDERREAALEQLDGSLLCYGARKGLLNMAAIAARTSAAV